MPLPTIPLEIWSHIVKLSLPVRRSTLFLVRYHVLLVYSLANSTWKELAQVELAREPGAGAAFCRGARVDRAGSRREERRLRAPH